MHPVYAALQRIAAFLGVPARADGVLEPADHTMTVAKAARAFGVRVRPVQLQGVWWKEDGGPFLGFYSGSGTPLLPESPGRYRAFDAGEGASVLVDGDLAAKLDRHAYSLYAPFGTGSVSLRQIVRFSLRSFWRRDMAFALGAGAVGGILELAVPFLTGVLFDYVVPARETWKPVTVDRAAACALRLYGVCVSACAFIFADAIEARLDNGLESALWDRILNLPVEFFREYSAGDLANRASGVTKIRKNVSQAVVTVALTCLFSLFSLLYLFTISMPGGLRGACLRAHSGGGYGSVLSRHEAAGFGEIDVERAAGRAADPVDSRVPQVRRDRFPAGCDRPLAQTVLEVK